MIFLTICTST